MRTQGYWLTCMALLTAATALAAEPYKNLPSLEARRAPEWVTRGVMYQIWPRTFTQEGTLKAATERLTSIAELGCTIVYLCPITLSDDDPRREFWSTRQKASPANNPRNPYRMKDYFRVDPEYGTDADLHEFVDTAHKLGLKVLLDLVYFHAGPTWAATQPAEFIQRDASGKPITGEWNFPRLNFQSQKLREHLWENMLYWVKEFKVDGYRCDVADMVPLDFWEEARVRLNRLRPDLAILSEGQRTADQVKAFDLDYGFSWFNTTEAVLAHGQPASALRKLWEKQTSLRPRGGARFIRYTDNHDLFRSDVVLGEGGAAAMAVVNFTIDGVPFLYNGQEIGDCTPQDLFSHWPIRWEAASLPKGAKKMALHRKLCLMRTSEKPLTHGEVVWLDNDQPDAVLSFLRVCGEERIVSIVNLSNRSLQVQVEVPAGCPAAFGPLLADGKAPVAAEGKLTATLGGFGYFVGKTPYGLPQSYRKAWNDPAVRQRIEQGIERNRKGDATLQVLTADGRPAADAKLEIQQTGHEFLFGCNAFVLGQFDKPEKNLKYEQTFARLFNFATVPFYWEGTEPVQGELRYAEPARDMWRRPPGDRFIPFAKKYGVTLKGHPLLWHAYNPPWLPKDADVLKRLYQKRFAEIASRFAEQISVFDVVNESLVCPKAYPLFTPDHAYVNWAFHEVHRVFRPENTLMINEVMTVSHHGAGEANAYYRQVRELQQQGAKVEGIGFQYHVFSPRELVKHLVEPDFAPNPMLDVYDSFAAFKLPLYVTEITVPTPPDGGQALQAEMVANLYRLWFSAPRMAGITWWNLGDGTAVRGENKAVGGLVDENLDPKLSFRTLDRLINREWKTRLTAQTDAQGAARFRGFYGRYTVKVTAGGKTEEFQVDLSQKGPATQRLKLKP